MNQDSDHASTPEQSSRTAIPAPNRGALFVVFLVVFIDLLGFGIIIPLLGLYGEKRYLDVLWPGAGFEPLRGVILGLLMSAFSAMQFIFAPIWGKASDRFGRKPILLIGLAGSVVFYALLGFALDLDPGGSNEQLAIVAIALMFVARLGQGIAGATIPTAQAAIADSTTPEKRKVGMALIGAAFGIGFTFGPLIGALCLTIVPDNPGALGYSAAGLSLISLLLGFRLLKETRHFGEESPRRKWISWHDTKEVLTMPAVGLLILLFFLVTLGFAAFEPTLGFLNEEILGVKRNQNYLIFAYVGFVLLITQGYFYRKLAKRFSEEKFMTLGVVLMGAGLGFLGTIVVLLMAVVTLPFAMDEVWTVLLIGTMISLSVSVVGFAFLTQSVQSLISRRGDAERQGEILGVNQSASAMARILGPLLGLILYKAHPSHLLPYAFGAILILAMLPFLSRIRAQPVGE